MKKIVSLILVASLCMMSLVGCGDKKESDSSESVSNKGIATVVTNQGETETVCAEDLMAACDGNEASFEKKYMGAEISFVGTVSKIKTDADFYNGNDICSNQNASVIYFEEGWAVAVCSQNNKNVVDFADVNVGDKLEVKSAICGAREYTEFMVKCFGENRCVWAIGDEYFGYEGHEPGPDWKPYNAKPTSVEFAK